METKRTHFKMYKSGRRWVFACAVLLVTLGAGSTVTANADVAGTESSSSSLVSGESSTDASSASSSSASDSSTAAASTTSESSETSSQSRESSQPNESHTSDADVQSSQAKKTTSVKAATPVTKASAAKTVKVNASLKQSIKATVKKGTAPKRYVHTSLTAAAKAAASTKSAQSISNLLHKLAGTNATAAAVTPYADTGIQAGGSVYDDYPDLNNILGVSSVFHIFAREAELNAHTNGNIAVQNLIGNVNFGTNIIEELLDKDISYIQNITNIANSSFVSGGDSRENKVVFGEGITIDISNPNRPMVNGEYIDHLLASEVYQDQNGQTYIDFDAEFAKLKALNEALANQPSEATYSNSDFDDQNNRVIDISNMTPNDKNQIVINLTPDVLNGNTPLTISGLSPDADGTTVIINVDTGTDADYDINSQIKIIYSDGSERDNHETEDFGDNHLLWNFYNSGASDKQYTGTLDFKRPFQGSILAPSATVVASANIDGNIIADKVIVNAETHRWDLQDNKDNEEDVDDEDENDFEIPVHPGIEVPGIPDTEEPDTENPGTETPGTEEPDTEDPDVEEPEDNGGDEDLTYEHEHPDYTEEEAADFEDDLINFEEENNVAGEEALLNKVDAAIAAARAKGDTQLVAQLESVRSNILRALGLSDGLPQTGEANDSWLSAVGFVLAGTLLATGVAVDRKRRY
ncbi:collagen-binding domain-containing protein [Levilactobacillus yiduensis]|uniref:collagen-binding domain-containing protein n=1 Tax=Levilactobacillus yiduensis TaxID=2953880 RepID=UPI000EF34001|nr:collagen-binding domain-containing protein [Levilactobacillus yiduensis]AYM01928.1 LPXTG cell wall anchor domain-containing protein [Levilactobacillus brevis]